ncbi:hypothetical protein YC2023_006503 [Brassica napus]
MVNTQSTPPSSLTTRRLMTLSISFPGKVGGDVTFMVSSATSEAVNSSENALHLNLCNAFHGNTCCSSSLALQNLATHGEASKDCLYLFELLECSICHPDVGGPLRICASFCDSVFKACSDAYFSTSDSTNQVIVPCGARNGTYICEKASKLETNGTSFCEAVGFSVQADVLECISSCTNNNAREHVGLPAGEG